MSDVLNHFPAPQGTLADLRVIHLGTGDDHARALEPGIRAWVQVISGHVHVCGRELREGQGVLLEGESVLASYAEAESLLLIAELRQEHC